MRLRRLAVVFALAGLPACRESYPQRLERAREHARAAGLAIDEQHARYSRGAALGSADSIAILYAEDAVVMPPGAPMLTGRDSIRAMFAAWGPFTITFATQEVWATDGDAIERGTFAYTLTPPGGRPETHRGKYLVRWERWERAAGQWLISQDIWNEDD